MTAGEIPKELQSLDKELNHEYKALRFRLAFNKFIEEAGVSLVAAFPVVIPPPTIPQKPPHS